MNLNFTRSNVRRMMTALGLSLDQMADLLGISARAADNLVDLSRGPLTSREITLARSLWLMVRDPVGAGAILQSAGIEQPRWVTRTDNEFRSIAPTGEAGEWTGQSGSLQAAVLEFLVARRRDAFARWANIEDGPEKRYALTLAIAFDSAANALGALADAADPRTAAIRGAIAAINELHGRSFPLDGDGYADVTGAPVSEYVALWGLTYDTDYTSAGWVMLSWSAACAAGKEDRWVVDTGTMRVIVYEGGIPTEDEEIAEVDGRYLTDDAAL